MYGYAIFGQGEGARRKVEYVTPMYRSVYAMGMRKIREDSGSFYSGLRTYREFIAITSIDTLNSGEKDRHGV